MSNGFQDLLKSFGGEENGRANGFNTALGNLLNNGHVQNFLNDENIRSKISGLASQFLPSMLTPEILSQILDAHPEISNEDISAKINRFKKEHPESDPLIQQYLGAFKENNDQEEIYNIREFIKSDDCKRALDDPNVNEYLKQAINSPDIRDKMQKVFADTIKQAPKKS